ncbi:hypothetical protein TIFTF001_020135 [Ficus carica]|uniref:Uncharacterized protein n=1 Tax=Ficus carica TaxID=3494 RepID=A0AA88DAR3_FICCA|nr:hypothetical protein TIFTF001_020135 [Ficus carica]
MPPRQFPITFTDDETDRLLHPHNDVLIREIRVADNVIRRILIDNGSSADIMFMDAFSRLRIEGAMLTPAQIPLYGFVGECVRSAGSEQSMSEGHCPSHRRDHLHDGQDRSPPRERSNA